MSRIVMLPIAQIDLDSTHPQPHIMASAIQKLAENIRLHGLKKPLVVRPLGERYQVVIGERRWRACRIVGHSLVPCYICPITGEDPREQILMEWLSDRDLLPIEKGLALRKLYLHLKSTDPKITWDGVARRAKVRARQAYQLYNLSLLPSAILEMISAGRLSPGHGAELARLQKHRKRQGELARLACRPKGAASRYGLSVKQLRQHVGECLGRPVVPVARVEKCLADIHALLGGEMQAETRRQLVDVAHEILHALETRTVRSTAQSCEKSGSSLSS